MIFATGDMHGDFRRLSADIFTEQKQMTKTDYVIVCGDFGIWNKSREQAYWLDWLEDKPFTTLFVSGNHENYDLLAELPCEDWGGGIVQRVRPSILHLTRGQMFVLDGKRFFTMGGASSHDIQDGILDPEAPDYREQRKRLDKRGALYRVNHLSWWKEELPSETEYQSARTTLDSCGWKTDYVISHCCPTSIADILGRGLYQADALTDFFEEIKERLDFQYWLFGHYHENRSLNSKFILLYEQILMLESK